MIRKCNDIYEHVFFWENLLIMVGHTGEWSVIEGPDIFMYRSDCRPIIVLFTYYNIELSLNNYLH